MSSLNYPPKLKLRKEPDMMTMQAFYTSAFTNQETSLNAFVRIARASLKQILAVRSELAWDVWSS
jgi:hypothetical protein